MKNPAVALLLICGVAVSAQQAVPTVAPVAARAIEPPARPLPAEAESAGVTRFSFVAYGDSRGQADGLELQTAHGLVVDAMLDKIRSLASTPFPVASSSSRATRSSAAATAQRGTSASR